jgi:hypothetical protein
LQVPLFEQSPLSGSVATQRFFGSEPPAVTGEQVPTLPVTLQLWHTPALPAASEHALSQQTPSVQKPLEHSVAAPHACPGAFRPQELLMQMLGAMHWALPVHVLLHEPPLQTNAPHIVALGVLQTPAPSQNDAAMASEGGAVGQLASLHFVVVSHFAQAPALQRPVVPQVMPTVTAQRPCGSAPLFTCEQVPSVPGKLQDVHAPVQSLLQQTPWAQWPPLHSLLSVQGAGGSFSPQEPFMQVLGFVHWLSLVHLSKHVEVPLQAKGAQDREVPGTH